MNEIDYEDCGSNSMDIMNDSMCRIDWIYDRRKSNVQFYVIIMA